MKRTFIRMLAGSLFPAALALAALAGWASAGTPGRISYQGTLRKDGALFTGTVPMEFRITGEDGTVYWTSGSTDVPVAGGLFRYQLGTPNEDQFAAIPWGSATPYVLVGIDGGWLPREPLFSSAYSLHSLSAESSSGTFTAYNGDIRISTTTGSRGIVFQDGTVQYTAGGFWYVSGANIYFSAGGIGAGTASPQARLDVQAAPSGYPQIWRNSSGVIQSSMSASGVIYADGSGLRNISVAGDNLGNHTATQALNMAGSQILGVSSITVTGALGVAASKISFTPQAYVANAAPSQYGGLYVSTNVYLPAGAKYYGDGSALTGISGGLGGGDNLGDHVLTKNLVAGPYWFSGDGDNEGVSVDAGGNVGIGITGGAARLDVSGSAGNYIQIWRNNSGVIQASMTATGLLYADASRMRNLPAGDNLGNHTATRALNLASNDILNVSTITVSSITSSGASVVFGRSILVSGLTGGSNRCVYVDPSGVLRAKGEGSDCGLSGVTGDNLGNHTATQDLNLAGFRVLNASLVSVAGPLGISAAELSLSAAAEISSAAAAQYGGVYISSNVYLPAGAKYYGDGSALTGISGGAGDNLGDHTATQALNLAFNDILNVSTITVSSITSSGASVVFGRSILVSNMTGGSNRCVYVDPSGVLRAKGEGSDCGLSGVTGDNLGNHTATQDLNMAAHEVVGVSTISVAYLTSVSGGVSFSTDVFVNGNLGVRNASPQESLDVNGNILSSSLAGADNRCVYVDQYGVLRAKSSDCGLASPTGDNLGNYTMTQNLIMGNNWLSNDGTSKGITVDSGGNVGIGRSGPGARLDVQGAVGGYVQVWRDPSGVIQASMTSTGLLYADASKLRNLPSSADNLGDHTLTQNLVVGTYWVSNHGENKGLAIDSNGNVGVGMNAPVTLLDLQPAAGDQYAQVWRNSSGVIQASMTSTGLLYADASKLRNLPSGADNLGNHTASQALNMAGFQIVNVSSLTVTGKDAGTGYSLSLSSGVSAPNGTVTANLFSGSGALLTGLPAAALAGTVNDARLSANVLLLNSAQNVSGVKTYQSSFTVTSLYGAALPRVYLAQGVELSSSPAAQYGGVAVSTNVYLPPGAKYYGDGSALSGIAGDNLGNHTASQNLNLAFHDMINVSTITAGYLSGYGAGVVFSTNVLVANGSIGVGTASPQEKLQVNGNILSSALSGASNRCVYVDSNGVLRAKSSDCGTASGGDNLGDHTLTQNLVVGSHWLSYDGSPGGLTVNISSGVGIGLPSAQTRLDVQGAPGDQYVQIWRDSSGVIRSSMAASGLLYADASKLRNVPQDNLGDHIATQALNMSGFGLDNVSVLTAAAGQAGISLASNVFVGGGLSGAGPAVFGNLAYQVDQSTAVSVASRFTPSAQVYNNYALSAKGEADPAFNMGGAPAHSLYGGSFEAALRPGNANTYGALAGVSGLASHYGTNQLDSAYGVSGIAADMLTGGITSAYGGIFGAAAGMSGVYDNTIGSGYGVYAQNSVLTAASSMANSYAVFVQSPSAPPGRMTNNFGVFINDQTGFAVGGNFNLYSAGARSVNYFAGSVGIGTLTPSASLQISSAAAYAGNLLVLSTGAVDVAWITGGGEVHATKFFGDGSGLTGVAGGTGMANPAAADLDMNGKNINNTAILRTGGVIADEISTFGDAVVISTNVGVGGKIVLGDVTDPAAPLSIAGDATGAAISIQSNGGGGCKLLISDATNCNAITGSTMIGTNGTKALCMLCGS